MVNSVRVFFPSCPLNDGHTTISIHTVFTGLYVFRTTIHDPMSIS